MELFCRAPTLSTSGSLAWLLPSLLPRWQVGRARPETLSQFLKITEPLRATTLNPCLPLPICPSLVPPGYALVGFPKREGDPSGETRAHAQGGLGRCQAHSRGRGMGVAGRCRTCSPTEGFGICRHHPRQELGSGRESQRAGHVAWSLLCPQSEETEIHVKPEDRCWWWKPRRGPAWWGGLGAATALPHPEEKWHRVWWRGPHYMAQLMRGLQDSLASNRGFRARPFSHPAPHAHTL